MTDAPSTRRPTIATIVVADPVEAWVGAGFTVDAEGTSRIGGVGVKLVGRDHGRKILRWSLRDARLDPVDGDRGGPPGRTASLDGLVTEVAVEVGPGPAATHPNGVTSIDHVVIASPDPTRTTMALEAVGFAARRERSTDSYGAPMRQIFFRAGEVVIELVGPAEPQGDGPATFFGLAFTVDDLEATAALLGDGLGERKDAVQPGRRIATLRHRDLGVSVAIALMSPDVSRQILTEVSPAGSPPIAPDPAASASG